VIRVFSKTGLGIVAAVLGALVSGCAETRPGYRLHPNGGGWVAVTAQVEPSVFVGPDARIEDEAV